MMCIDIPRGWVVLSDTRLEFGGEEVDTTEVSLIARRR
jgi:hypothetical protein